MATLRNRASNVTIFVRLGHLWTPRCARLDRRRLLPTDDVAPRIAAKVLALLALACSVACAKGMPFTIRDDVAFASFGGTEGNALPANAVRFSPDGRYFAVYTTRGRVDLNRVEDSLRFYRSRDVESFLHAGQELHAPDPLWTVTRSNREQGAIGEDWRWLPDSTGVAFVENEAGAGGQSLVLADIGRKTIERLTLPGREIRAFDIRDRRNYVYTAVGANKGTMAPADETAPSVVGTGHSLFELLLPDGIFDHSTEQARTEVLAVVNGSSVEVRSRVIGPYALSPDGRWVATSIAIPAPASWLESYPPPFEGSPYHIRLGEATAEYVRIDLQTGAVEALTDAPTADAGGWPTGHGASGGTPRWSGDSQRVLLPGTFLKSADQSVSEPCIAVVDLQSKANSCVEKLKRWTKAGFESDYHFIESVRFVGKADAEVRVNYVGIGSVSGSTEYRHAAPRSWEVDRRFIGISPEQMGADGLQVTTRQALNEPPVLVANEKQTSKVLWDPNPQLQNIDIGETSVLVLKDNEGREWNGGIYMPAHYQAGRRYPLVIQTHGFKEHEFNPSGLYPTAMAARTLAAAGIVVLQIGESKACPSDTKEEGPCQAAVYEAAVRKLVSQGLVDSDKVGIIGFSRTGIYVMEALTARSLDIKAALLADSNEFTYSEYILTEDIEHNTPGAASPASQMESLVGSPPFGPGLQLWLQRVPGFNLDKVTAAVLIEPEGRGSLLGMWEGYAGLRYLHKPVDLIVLNMDGDSSQSKTPHEHVFTNPALRMASQGSSVDWFRFWLQGYERATPVTEIGESVETLKEQYRRWESLCDQRRATTSGKSSVCVATQH